MDLADVEDIKKGWQGYIKEVYKKDCHDPDNHNSVITHVEPDILECEVTWALGNITRKNATGGDGIPVGLFQMLKDDAVKLLHSICQQIWKMQQWPQDWKRSVFTPIPTKGNAKEYSNYLTIALISHTSKVMLKTLQARLQQYLNKELADVQARFTTGRGTRDQIANIIEIARKFQKNICCKVTSVVSDSVQPHRRQPTRLPRPWDSPGKNTGVGCHFLLQCMKVKSESEVAQSCPTLSDPMDCSPPGSSIHGSFQARVLEWVASASSPEKHLLLLY